MVPAFKTIRERSAARKYGFVSLLSVVGKFFEKVVHSWLIDHLEKYGLSSDF